MQFEYVSEKKKKGEKEYFFYAHNQLHFIIQFPRTHTDNKVKLPTTKMKEEI